MTTSAGLTGGFSFVSSAHFSFFEQGQQAKISPSYFLNPHVRISDQAISLNVIRTGDKQRRERTANFNRGIISPFGHRQAGYQHNITRFRQAKLTLQEVRQYEQQQQAKEGIKGIMRAISKLANKRQTLEDKEELARLRGLLSPSYAVRKKQEEQAEKEQFKRIWANVLNSELTTRE